MGPGGIPGAQDVSQGPRRSPRGPGGLPGAQDLIGATSTQQDAFGAPRNLHPEMFEGLRMSLDLRGADDRSHESKSQLAR